MYQNFKLVLEFTFKDKSISSSKEIISPYPEQWQK